MATSEQIQTFINSMITQAQKGYQDYGVLPSVTIAQGAWESGWGLSYLSRTDNNLFGIKYAGNHATSITITQGTAPSDGTGGYYCHYQSWGDSCLDHGCFLKTNSRYAGVFSETTPQGQLNAIWLAGYAQEADGSLTQGYVENIMSIINANNLTQYDTGTYNPVPTPPPAPDHGNANYAEVWNKIIATSYNINQLTTTQLNVLQSLYFTTKVKIHYTYDRRGYQGYNFTGKRLTIDDNSYIIVDVENNGFIKLTTDLNNKCYKFVNPRLIDKEV